MKIIITRNEIRAKFGIPPGANLEIPHERKPVTRKRKKKARLIQRL